jgi:AraC family transcriptional regulator, ethanolamine operon transcriptional activator
VQGLRPYVGVSSFSEISYIAKAMVTQIQPSPSQPPPATGVIVRQMDDIDHLAQVMGVDRQVNLLPLHRRPFHCWVTQVQINGILLLSGQANCTIHHTGTKRADYIGFDCLLETTGQPVISHGQAMGADTLYGFDSHRKSNVIFPAKTRLATIQVKRQMFEDYCQILEREDIDSRFLSTNAVRSPLTLPAYKHYFLEVLQLIQQRPQLLPTPTYQRLIQENLLALLIEAIPSTRTAAAVPPQVGRDVLVQQVRDYMLANIDRPLTLQDLYQTLGSSRRTLFNCFETVFGVTPMEYLKVLRLQGVRHALKSADPNTVAIFDIASRWGFWSPGHFARDYKTMFGERPSDTLTGRGGV